MLRPMPDDATPKGYVPPSLERQVRLFRNGRNQAVRIPREFELPGEEVVIRKEGERLVIEPVRRSSLLEWLAQQEPCEEADALFDLPDPPPEPFEL